MAIALCMLGPPGKQLAEFLAGTPNTGKHLMWPQHYCILGPLRKQLADFLARSPEQLLPGAWQHPSVSMCMVVFHG